MCLSSQLHRKHKQKDLGRKQDPISKITNAKKKKKVGGMAQASVPA
jgi:hypothetical protein